MWAFARLVAFTERSPWNFVLLTCPHHRIIASSHHRTLVIVPPLFADTYKHPRIPPKLITGFQLSCTNCSCLWVAQAALAEPLGQPLTARLTAFQATWNRAITARHRRLCARCPYSCRYVSAWQLRHWFEPFDTHS